MPIQAESEPIAAALKDWLSEQTESLVGPFPAVELRFSARDEAGHLIGGATGTLAHGVLHVQLLALSPEHRGAGLGAELMRALEDAALEAGATQAWVDTMEWEAPDFYQKQGYRVLGVVGAVAGRRHFFLSKKLGG